MVKITSCMMIVFVFCGAAFGVDFEISWISGSTRPDFSRTPADPTTNDRIEFVIPTDVFRNERQAESYLGGTPTLVIDTEQRRIDLKFQPPVPSTVPTTYDPVSGLEGYFGPLEEGTWLFYVQFQGVIYIDSLYVSVYTGGSSGDNLTEHFTSDEDAFDLMYESILFTPTSSGTSYDVRIQEISELPTDPSGGTDLNLGDDAFKFVKLTGSNAVSIYDTDFTGFYVGSNGYITFTEGDQDYSESLQDHFDTPRVSALFRDLNPTAGGQVSLKQLTNRVVVTWENVPQYGSSNTNTFQVELYFDGRIRLSWEHIDARRGIVGLSDGLGVPSDFEEIDFSELSGGTTPASDYFVEQFTGDSDPFDLEYKSVTFSPNSGSAAYTAKVKDISELPTNPSGGTTLALGDDAFIFVKLIGSKTMSIYGSDFSGFYVGSNGYLTFTEGDRDYSESLVDHFDTLRVSSLFRDLNPSGGGQISWKQLTDRAVVTWDDVPQYGSNNSNTFQIALYFDGTIQLAWAGVDARQGIVGLSDGFGVPSDFQEVDFSKLSGGTSPDLDYPVEQFTSDNPFDLENTSITFTPNASGSGYSGEVETISGLPTNPSGGTNLSLGDDAFAFVKIAGSEAVWLYGNSFTSLYVGSNGYITFTEGDQDYSESLQDHFDTMRVSGLFRDLNPTASGSQVSWRQLSDRVAITWQNVREYGSSSSNTFQIELFFDGRIRLSWLEMAAQRGIVGLSDGGGVPSDFEQTDLSELSGTTPPPIDDFLTEQFVSNADPFDLEYTSVTFTPTADGTSYTGSKQSITSLPTSPTGGTDLGLSDDIWVRVTLSGRQVKVFNQQFSSFYVGSNGYITFAQGDTDSSETLEEHFETMRISGLYTDLTAAYTGSVTGKQLSNRVAITWEGVPEFSHSGENTFQIEMFYDGRIRLSWLYIPSPSNIVGLSDGHGLPADFVETDFSAQY
ncbi:MAG: hypothetical protein JXM79_09705 [Sedimentisphaerales bacterium]|nr:hypothetical protein [Sedimentisphaerales bacterium]